MDIGRGVSAPLREVINPPPMVEDSKGGAEVGGLRGWVPWKATDLGVEQRCGTLRGKAVFRRRCAPGPGLFVVSMGTAPITVANRGTAVPGASDASVAMSSWSSLGWQLSEAPAEQTHRHSSCRAIYRRRPSLVEEADD
jgi:hypothetical protein